LRGVRVGLGEDNTMARVGALQTVTWRLLPEEDRWTVEEETQIMGGEDTTIGSADARGLLVTITYEKAVYTAVLLRDLQGNLDESMAGVELDGSGFQKFPLILTKMPIGLRDSFANFLATTFDARVSVFSLTSPYLITTFEQYLDYIYVDEDGEPLNPAECGRALRTIIGAITVHIGFDMPGGSNALKTVDIQIAGEDLPRMIARGKKLGNSSGTPFMDALTKYVKAHLALDLRHGMVRVLKISCDAFALAAEGKAKFGLPHVGNDGETPQRRATRRLVNRLTMTAQGGSLVADGKGS